MLDTCREFDVMKRLSPFLYLFCFDQVCPLTLFRVFEKHPSLTQAVSTAMKALREKGVTSAGRSGATTAGALSNVTIENHI